MASFEPEATRPVTAAPAVLSPPPPVRQSRPRIHTLPTPHPHPPHHARQTVPTTYPHPPRRSDRNSAETSIRHPCLYLGCTLRHYAHGYATLRLRYATVLRPTTVATTARLPCHAQCMRHAQPSNMVYPAYMCIRDTNEGSLHLPSLRQHTESMFHTLYASFHTLRPRERSPP